MASSSSLTYASLSLPQPSVLLSTSGSRDSPGSLSLVSLSTPSITSPLLSFKPYVSSLPHAVSIIPPSAATSTEGLLATIEESKNLLHLHSIPLFPGVSSVTARFIPPQRLSCLSLSPDGSLLCAGASDGHAYVWEVASGRLLASWEPHFRKVTVVRWDSRGDVVATGGEDGRVCVWAVSGLLHPISGVAGGSAGNPVPYATFSTHLLPVTSLAFSPASGVFPAKLRLWSSSSDGSLKLWDLRTRSLLTNFEWSDPSGQVEVVCFAADPTGRFCFVATSSGRLERIDLYRTIRGDKAGGWEARGGGGIEDVEKVGAGEDNSNKAGIQLSSPASSLALLPSSSHLLIGTSSPPLLQILDVRSLQVIRTTPLSETSGSTAIVSNLLAFYRPIAGMSRAEMAAKRRGIAEQLERAINHNLDGEDEAEGYWCQVPTTDVAELDYLTPPTLMPSHQKTMAAIFQAPCTDHQSAVLPLSSDYQSSGGLYDLQAQVNSLKLQLGQAEKWNKEMWSAVVAKGLTGAGENA